MLSGIFEFPFLEYANGDVYDGDFSSDKRHGKGTFLFSSSNNGAMYRGDFAHGNFQVRENKDCAVMCMNSIYSTSVHWCSSVPLCFIICVCRVTAGMFSKKVSAV